MSLITVSEGKVTEYHGEGTPAVARLYANRDFVTSEGVIVERGSHSKPNYWQEFGVHMNGDDVIIESGDVYTTTNSTKPNATYKLEIYDAEGNRLKARTLDRLRVPPDVNPTTWADLVIYSDAQPADLDETLYYDVSETNILLNLRLLASDPILTRAATTAIRGHVLFNSPPADPNIPLAVGPNDPLFAALLPGIKNDIEIIDPADDYRVVHPQLAAAKAYRHASASGFSLAALKTEAINNPGTDFILQVDTTVIDTSSTHPDNLYLDFSKGGVFSVALGQTVNINPPMNAPPGKRLFTGAGTVIIKAHPAGGLLKAEWWLPPAITGVQVISATTRDAMMTSQNNNYGSTLLFPQGRFQSAGGFQIYHGALKGSGTHYQPDLPAPFPGTILELTASGASLVRVMQGARGVKIHNLAAYAPDSITTAQAVLLTGTAAVDPNIVGVTFDNFIAYGFEDQIKCARIGAGNYEFDNILVTDSCQFINYSSSGFYLDSLNSKCRVLTKNFNGKWNGTSVGLRLLRWGTFEVDGQARGIYAASVPPGYPETEQFTVVPSAFNTTTNVITKVGHNLQTGDSLRANCPSGNDTNLPTVAGGFSFAAGRKSWVNRIDADTYTLHRSPNDSLTGTSPLDITAQPTADVKFWSQRPNIAASSQRPFAGIFLGSQSGSGGLTVRNWQDEGMQYFIYMEDWDLIGAHADFYYSPPIVLEGVITQGQIQLNHSCRIIMIGCSLPLDSIHDTWGVRAKIDMIGCSPLFFDFGAGLVPYSRAGFQPSRPWRFDDFKGFSTVTFHDEDRGPGASAYGNDTPVFAFRSENNTAPVDRKLELQRLSAVYPGAWDFRNSYDPAPIVNGAVTANPEGDQQLNIVRMASHFITKGYVMNELPIQAAQVSGSDLILDLSKANDFSATLAADMTLKVQNGPAARMEVRLHHVSSGATSYDLTGGTAPDVLMDPFETGILDGTRRTLEFIWDGTRLIEVGRRADRSVVGARLAADVNTTNDTSLNDRFSVNVDEGVYEIEVHLIVTAGTGGYKTALGGTATYSGRFQRHAFVLNDAAATVFSGQSWVTPSDEKIWTVSATAREIVIRGSIVVTAGGSLIVQSAQETSHADATTEYAGSYVKLAKLS